MIQIRNTDDDIGKTYSKRIRECETLDDLRALLKTDYPFLDDALLRANTITVEEWRWAKRNAKSKTHQTAKKVIEVAGDILMPEKLIQASMISIQCCVPEGCALLRLLEYKPEVKS